MGRGAGRGPKQLRFRNLLDSLGEAAREVPDLRQATKVSYSLEQCYRSAFALFFVQDPSLLEFQRRFQQQLQQNNLSTVFDVETIPSDTQLRDVLDSHDYTPITTVYKQWVQRLQRSKELERFRFLNGSYLITLDGSEYFNSEAVHCEKCLSRVKSNGRREYHHQVLQAAIVHPERREVLPLAPEFIRVQDGSEKQDCEAAAGVRAIETIRSNHRQIEAVLVADALFATTKLIQTAAKQRFRYIFGVKPGSHKTLFEDVRGFRSAGMLDCLTVTDSVGRRYCYEWACELPLFATADAPVVTYVELSIFDASGKRTRHFSWITDLAVDEHNVAQVVRAARARWKIENENFNTLKNHGYHLEHNFGHGKQYLSEAFFVLNTLAFFMHQIFALVDELYQSARGGFSARREFWNAVRAALRLMLFSSWDHVLERIDGPPLAAP